MSMKKKAMKIGLLVVILITASFAVIFKVSLPFRAKIGDYINRIEGKTLSREFKYKIKSGNLSTDYEIETVLQDMEKLDLNTINLPVAINVENLSSSDMEVDEASLRKAKELLKKLRWKKINVILEPYPWIQKGEKYETYWNPDDKEAFFDNWYNKILYRLVDEIAVPYHVDSVIVASNLVYLEKYEDQWAKIIDNIRQNYKGLITYKTNWWHTAAWDKTTQESYEKKLNNSIFLKVDYISIAAYFELTDKPKNTVDELMADLYKSRIFNREQNIKGEIQNFNAKWQKPVFFGELGFPAKDRAAFQPWNHLVSDKINPLEQANCFEAYKRVFTDDWFLGFSVFAIGEHGPDKNYYPSNESVEVIQSWFRGE